jgi:hypothetical protein
MDPTPPIERTSRRSVFLFGVVLGLVLLFAFVAGPPLVSTLFPGDGTGSPGNPTHAQPVEQKTK